MYKKPINKKVKVESTYEIVQTAIRNGMVYLKIEQDGNWYKWIKYATADNNSEDIEGKKK